MKANHDIENPDAFEIKQFDCKVCTKSFTLESSLRYHNKWVHHAEQILKCKLYEKQVSNMLHLKMHERRHIRDHICDTCGSSWNGVIENVRITNVRISEMSKFVIF